MLCTSLSLSVYFSVSGYSSTGDDPWGRGLSLSVNWDGSSHVCVDKRSVSIKTVTWSFYPNSYIISKSYHDIWVTFSQTTFHLILFFSHLKNSHVAAPAEHMDHKSCDNNLLCQSCINWVFGISFNSIVTFNSVPAMAMLAGPSVQHFGPEQHI